MGRYLLRQPADQLSKENPTNGEFTRVVIEGFTGAVAIFGNDITSAAMDTYVDQTVKARVSYQ